MQRNAAEFGSRDPSEKLRSLAGLRYVTLKLRKVLLVRPHHETDRDRPVSVTLGAPSTTQRNALSPSTDCAPFQCLNAHNFLGQRAHARLALPLTVRRHLTSSSVGADHRCAIVVENARVSRTRRGRRCSENGMIVEPGRASRSNTRFIATRLVHQSPATGAS